MDQTWLEKWGQTNGKVAIIWEESQHVLNMLDHNNFKYQETFSLKPEVVILNLKKAKQLQDQEEVCQAQKTARR